MILLPGTLCDERLFTHFIKAFPQTQVINLRSQKSVEEMLSSVEQVTRERFVLVGFSMGGYIAQEFVLRHPRRVKALILIGSSIEGYPEPEKEVVLKYLPMIQKGLFKGVTDKRLQQFLHPQAYAQREIRDLVQAMAGPDASEVYYRQLCATLVRRDLTHAVSELNCPTLLVGGREDQIVSAESLERSARAFLLAELRIIEACGHFVPLEKPEELHSIIHEFLLNNLN